MSLMTEHPFLIFQLTAADLAIVLLMIVVFLLAVLLPYPGTRRAGGRGR